MPLINYSTESIIERGHALEKEYFQLQRALQTPAEMLNAQAINRINNFFSEVVKLGACVDSLWRQHSYQLVFAFSPYNVAGCGHILTSVQKEELMVSQKFDARHQGYARYILHPYFFIFLSVLN
jgi:hypothetical protein